MYINDYFAKYELIAIIIVNRNQIQNNRINVINRYLIKML